MKIFLTLIAFINLILFACSDDDNQLIYDYHAHIEQPAATSYQLGDSLKIQINFESHTGETVHHINVRITNKATGIEVYSKPTNEHVDDPSGSFEFTDHILLNATNGFSANSSWVLEAKVWGHEDGIEEVTSKIEFTIKP
ncbi:MAG: hypothetical protein JNL65_03995 [Saprospiraceae bacterium]|nr:hypothetical protein [Saprospiraceae bacterium]HRG69251.1 hypothetical protein [Saprospiraceae bacterium]